MKRVFNNLVFLANWLHSRAIQEKRSNFLYFIFRNYFFFNLTKTWKTMNITDVFLAEFALKIKHSKIIRISEVEEMQEIEFEKIRTKELKTIRFKRERYEYDYSNTGKLGLIPIVNDARAAN